MAENLDKGLVVANYSYALLQLIKENPEVNLKKILEYFTEDTEDTRHARFAEALEYRGQAEEFFWAILTNKNP